MTESAILQPRLPGNKYQNRNKLHLTPETEYTQTAHIKENTDPQGAF